MAMGRSLAGKIASLALVASQSSALFLFAAPSVAISPTPPPGTYPDSVLVRVSPPEGTRVELSVNGQPFAPATSPIALSAPDGEEREFAVEARVYSLQPESPPIGQSRWQWRVDRKPPLPPSLTASARTGGMEVFASTAGAGSVRYRMWHPSAESSAEGAFRHGSGLFVPSGASFVAWAVDEAGNASDPVSPEFLDLPVPSKPFRVLNPIPGVWANRQTLVIESAPGTEIRYSLDGSDPAVSGLAYDGPAPIGGAGAKTLRVVAYDDSGKRYAETIAFSVEEGVSPPPGFSDEPPESGSAEFTEIAIPEGYAWSFGDSAPKAAGGRTIAVAAVRGAIRRYPITLTDGGHRWRYVTESGSSADSGGASAPVSSPSNVEGAAPVVDETTAPLTQTSPVASPASSPDSAIHTPEPVVRVHDWNFVSFAYRDPVYWSLDGSSWYPYREPLFVDRSADSLLRWYSATWKSGATQKLRLPAKPLLVGANPGAIVAEPAFLRVSASPMTFRYTVGSEYLPPKPGAAAPELASGLLLEVPSLAESSFIVRILAECDGIEQGELVTWITVDRNPPPDPATGLELAPAWSRSPVRFAPSGDGTIEVTVEPPLASRSGNGWILSGASGKAVEYTVSARAVDGAGNSSGTTVSRVTVELATAYVGGGNPDGTVPSPRDGSPRAPFASLDDALGLAGSGDLRIIARGEVPLSGVARITGTVSIDGKGSSIRASDRAFFQVAGGSLSLDGCAVTKTIDGADDGPIVRAGRPPALFEVTKGSFTARDVDVAVTGGTSSCALRASLSRVACDSSRFTVVSGEYGQALDLEDSALSLSASSLACEARTVSVLGLARTRARIDGATISAIPVIAGRAVEAWDSVITLSKTVLERKDSRAGKRASDEEKNRDTALWLDSKSAIPSAKGISSNGFWRELERGKR